MIITFMSVCISLVNTFLLSLTLLLSLSVMHHTLTHTHKISSLSLSFSFFCEVFSKWNKYADVVTWWDKIHSPVCDNSPLQVFASKTKTNWKTCLLTSASANVTFSKCYYSFNSGIFYLTNENFKFLLKLSF